MSDGIIAISRMEDEEKEAEQDKQNEAAIAKRKKSKIFSDFVLTDFGISEEGTTRNHSFTKHITISLPSYLFSLKMFMLSF